MPQIANLRSLTLTAIAFCFGQPWAHAEPPVPLYPIYQNHHWGLINPTGEIILPAKFDQIGRERNGWLPSRWVFEKISPDLETLMTMESGYPVTGLVIPVRLDGKFGFATRNGELLALGQYDEIRSHFSEGLIEVLSEGLYGFANEHGELVIPPQFDRTQSFMKGNAFVKIGNLWGIIDRAGKMVVSPRWDEAGSNSRSLTPVRIGEHWGVVDRSGKVIVPFRFEKFTWVEPGSLIPIKDDKRFVYLHPDGKGTIAFELTCPKGWFGTPEARGFSFFAKLALFTCGDHYGLIDRQGNVVLEPKWNHIGRFYDGRAIVKLGKKSGIIDEDGRFILELTSEFRIHHSEEGFFSFGRHGRSSCGFLDHNGRVLFDTSEYFMNFFHDGLATARTLEGNKDGYVDRTGAWVIEPRFHHADPFRGPLAVVKQAVSKTITEIGYINRSGDVIYRVRLHGLVWPEHLIDPAGIGP